LGETRVDLLHLLEDLRDAYPGAIEETILTEIVANSLDSGATRISITTDQVGSKIVVCDDGTGMKRRDLARYHDVAATTKARGEGIGFAGVGIKLGLLVAKDVVTETVRGKSHVATEWRLSSRHRAPWKWISPPEFVAGHGTAVCLRLDAPLSPLLDAGYVESAIARHFEPLLDVRFGGLFSEIYPHGVAFEVNGRHVEPLGRDAVEIASLEVRLPRKRKPSAIGFLMRTALPLPENQRGLRISTRGKVIRSGWEWLGVSPSNAEQISGLIEVPALAACLALNKADFLSSGVYRATYLSYRKMIQEVVGAQLSAWGDARDSEEDARRRVARPLERDLERVLMDLSDSFPLLSALVEQRIGGQRKLPIGRAGGAPDGRALLLASVATAAERESDPRLAEETQKQLDHGTNGAESAPTESTTPPPEEAKDKRDTHPSGVQLPGTPGPRRPLRYGLGIRLESRPEDPELARFMESTVSVNDAHPAFRRATASRSEGYHIALSVAMALAPLAVEPAQVHGFVTAFLRHWGEALREGKQGKRARRRKNLRR